MFDNININY